jgi:hypothetical protein
MIYLFELSREKKRENLQREKKSAHRTAMREIDTHTHLTRIFCGYTRKKNKRKDR